MELVLCIGAAMLSALHNLSRFHSELNPIGGLISPIDAEETPGPEVK